MVATTSGTTSFSLDVDDIIEDALEPLKGDPTSGVEQQKARRALNLILIELQNRNVPLNKIATIEMTLDANVSEYSLDSSVSDVIGVSIKESSSDNFLPLDRVGVIQYHRIPDKTTSKRPTTYSIDRGRSFCTLKLWPVPDDAATYTLKLLVIKRIEDVNSSYQKIDLSYRYSPLIVAWLSYKLSMSREDITEEVKSRLKANLDETMMFTFEEDRERADFIIVPGGISGR